MNLPGQLETFSLAGNHVSDLNEVSLADQTSQNRLFMMCVLTTTILDTSLSQKTIARGTPHTPWNPCTYPLAKHLKQTTRLSCCSYIFCRYVTCVTCGRSITSHCWTTHVWFQHLHCRIFLLQIVFNSYYCSCIFYWVKNKKMTV